MEKRVPLLSAEDIKFEREKLMPSKGAVLNVTKVLQEDIKTVLSQLI